MMDTIEMGVIKTKGPTVGGLVTIYGTEKTMEAAYT
jgi:hypothetical protein